MIVNVATLLLILIAYFLLYFFVLKHTKLWRIIFEKPKEKKIRNNKNGIAGKSIS
tara:strand:+ start:88 stop:252 length:165 start_codon:yes stop_codon:yes gene_type:complete